MDYKNPKNKIPPPKEKKKNSNKRPRWRLHAELPER